MCWMRVCDSSCELEIDGAFELGSEPLRCRVCRVCLEPSSLLEEVADDELASS